MINCKSHYCTSNNENNDNNKTRNELMITEAVGLQLWEAVPGAFWLSPRSERVLTDAASEQMA